MKSTSIELCSIDNDGTDVNTVKCWVGKKVPEVEAVNVSISDWLTQIHSQSNLLLKEWQRAGFELGKRMNWKIEKKTTTQVLRAFLLKAASRWQVIALSLTCNFLFTERQSKGGRRHSRILSLSLSFSFWHSLFPWKRPNDNLFF